MEGHVIHEVSYIWKIKKFISRPETVTEKLVSPVFYAKTNNERTWELEVFPRGDTVTSQGHVALYARMKGLKSFEESTEGVSVACEFSLMNSKTKHKSLERNFTHNFSRERPLFGFRRFVSRVEVAEHLLQGMLTICCRLRWRSVDLDSPDVTEHVERSIAAPHGLSDDLRSLFNNSDTADVVLVVQGTRFFAHKLILGARSSVFKKIFRGETLDGELKIEGVEPRVVEEMLRYVYSDEIRDEKLLKDLLGIGDRFQLKGLKSRCEKLLINELSRGNALEMVDIAEVCHAWELKMRAMDLVSAGCDEEKDGLLWGDAREIPVIEMDIVGPIQ